MGILRGLFLALAAVLFVGCGYSPARPRQFDQSQQEAPKSYLDKDRIDKMHQGVARFEIYALIPQLSKDPIPVGSGSAWCIGLMSNYSLWMTCRHVAQLEPNEIAGLSYLNPGKKPEQGTVYDIKLSEESDVAIFKSNSRPSYAFQIAPNGLVADLSDGTEDQLAVAGFPHGLFPAFITVGFYKGMTDKGIRTDVASTHGNSGSPLIHIQTMRVVGMINRFEGERFGKQFRSDRLLAIPAYDISRFLKSWSDK